MMMMISIRNATTNVSQLNRFVETAIGRANALQSNAEIPIRSAVTNANELKSFDEPAVGDDHGCAGALHETNFFIKDEPPLDLPTFFIPAEDLEAVESLLKDEPDTKFEISHHDLDAVDNLLSDGEVIALDDSKNEENEASQTNDDKESDDEVEFFLDGLERFPMPAKSDANGYIKRENDLFSGTLSFNELVRPFLCKKISVQKVLKLHCFH